MRARRAALAAIVSVGVALAGNRALAQSEHAPGCLALAGNVSRELMVRPIGLRAGTGKMHQKVSTTSPKSQAFYDQGIAFLASYVWVEAARSFHEALRLDPKLAMAHLGLGKAYEGVEASDQARVHLEQAEALARQEKLTPVEMIWIALGRQQFDAIHAPAAEQAERLQAYRAAIDELIKVDPTDARAWVMRGNAEEPGAWGRGQAGGVGAIAYYETALRYDPKDFAAHHFLAHSYENIGQHAKAAEYARLYAAEARRVAHAQHMLGHVLPRLDDWKGARDQFLEADALERAYYDTEKVSPAEDWHHGHNLHLLGAVYIRLREEKNAERVLRDAYDLEDRGVIGGHTAGPYVQYLLIRGRNEEALTAARQIAARDSDVARLIGAALAGEALLALGRVDEARAELARAEGLGAKVEADLGSTRYGRILPVVTVQYVDILRGRLLLRGERPEEGDTILLAMADEVGHNPRLDAWASGMLRVDRARQDADRLGRKELSAGLRERVRGLEPEER